MNYEWYYMNYVYKLLILYEKVEVRFDLKQEYVLTFHRGTFWWEARFDSRPRNPFEDFPF